MNQDNIQNIFIGLLMAALILLGAGMYLVFQQVQSVATSVSSIGQAVTQLQTASKPQAPTTAAPQASEQPSVKIGVKHYQDTEAGTTGLQFDYPMNWVVSHYDDAFTSGQKNLLIGDLNGVHVTIERLQKGQEGLKGQLVNGYGRMWELQEMCSGATCPQEQYYWQIDDIDSAFAVRAYYDWEDRVSVKPLIDTILNSLQIGP